MEIEPFISGRDIALRPIRTEEQKQVVVTTTNQAPHHHFVTHTPFSEDDLETRLEDDAVLMFTVHSASTDDAVGFIMAKVQERDARAELGVAIREAEYGSGYGTAAVKELTDYVFERFPIQKVFGRRFGFNDPSRKVIEKCGFTEETTIPNHRYSRGELRDVVVAAIYRDEWNQSHIYSKKDTESTDEVSA